jgi:hypothetical protein
MSSSCTNGTSDNPFALILAYKHHAFHSKRTDQSHALRADTNVVQLDRVVQQRGARIEILPFFPVHTITATSTINNQSFFLNDNTFFNSFIGLLSSN